MLARVDDDVSLTIMVFPDCVEFGKHVVMLPVPVENGLCVWVSDGVAVDWIKVGVAPPLVTTPPDSITGMTWPSHAKKNENSKMISFNALSMSLAMAGNTNA